MSVKDKAMEYHNAGYNCSQSVLAACSKYTGLKEKTAFAVSAGFGTGVRSGEICGAISGAVMALGLAFPGKDASDAEAKKLMTTITKKCVSAAKCKYGCVRCAELKKNCVSCSEMIETMAQTAEKIIIETKKQERRKRWKFMKN